MVVGVLRFLTPISFRNSTVGRRDRSTFRRSNSGHVVMRRRDCSSDALTSDSRNAKSESMSLAAVTEQEGKKI